MILIISNIANEAAQTLVDMFPPGGASLITASQLHQSFQGGFSVGNFQSSQLRVDNRAVPIADIDGLISTVTNFYPQEFYYVQPDDREYVCNETNAFFTWFLAELTCRKLNPPTLRSLSGTGIHKIEWVKIAHALNIPIFPVHMVNSNDRSIENLPGATFTAYTLIGDMITTENPPDAVYNHMRALQRALSTPYLLCYFTMKDGGYLLADMLTTPDISSPANRGAIVHYFA